jgi:hypothetical protein
MVYRCGCSFHPAHRRRLTTDHCESMRLDTDNTVIGRDIAAIRPCIKNFSMNHLPAAWAACRQADRQ